MTAGSVDPIGGRYTHLAFLFFLYAEYKHTQTHTVATEYFPDCILLSIPLVFEEVSQLFEYKREV